MQSDRSPQPTNESGNGAKVRRLCEKARKQLLRGRRKAAIASLTKAIALDHECAEAYLLRAQIHFMARDWEKHVSDLNELIRLQPMNVEAHMQRAQAYYRGGQYERVVLDCNRALELNSTCADAYFFRSCALGRLGREADADADQRRWWLLSASPEDLEDSDSRDLVGALMMRGGNAMEAGLGEEAVQAYSAVLIEKPQHIEARFLRGQAYASLRRFEEASSDLLEAWRLKSEYDQIGRCFIVTVVGNEWEVLWAVFPDNGRGQHDAIALAEDLARDPAPLAEITTKIGQFEQTKIYQMKGNESEVIDWVWSADVKALPTEVLRIDDTTIPEEPEEAE